MAGMIGIDEFYDLLTEVCDELPEEMFRELHQGVIVSEETKISPHAKDDDLVILGEYKRSRYGNQITIYYGSFGKTMSFADRETLKKRLREVVRHEFRHHLENLGGVYGRDSLEYEDKVSIREYLERNNNK
jgi:predicted Zn-dependent protease with MMP-like domain